MRGITQMELAAKAGAKPSTTKVTFVPLFPTGKASLDPRKVMLNDPVQCCRVFAWPVYDLATKPP